MELFNKISKAATESGAKLSNFTTESGAKLSKFTSESSAKLKEQAAQIDQHAIIQKAVEIEYDKVKKAIAIAGRFVKALKALVPSVDILRDAAANYNISESEDKDTEYLDYLKTHLDAKYLLETLTPVAKSIPGGGIILSVLKMLVKK